MKTSNERKFKWTYTKTPIQVVAEDGVLKPGYIAPELVCYSSYGQSIGSVDLPDEYNPHEMYPCRVMVKNEKVIENSFVCIKEAMEWVERNVIVPEIRTPENLKSLTKPKKINKRNKPESDK